MNTFLEKCLWRRGNCGGTCYLEARFQFLVLKALLQVIRR